MDGISTLKQPRQSGFFNGRSVRQTTLNAMKIQNHAPSLPESVASAGSASRVGTFTAVLGWAWPPIVLIILPVLIGWYYVQCYAVNVVWEDQWGMLPLFEKHDAGTLTFLDFWKQHNEHRHAFPQITMYLLALATKWNVVAELWVTQVLLLSMLAMFLDVCRREFASPWRVWLMVPIAYLALSLRQSQNLLNGYHIALTMIVAPAVATLYCLYRMNGPRRRGLKFVSAIAMATVTTFSGGMGPPVWIAGLVPLELLPLDRWRKTVFFAVWAVLGVVEWILYFWGYQRPPQHPDYNLSLQYGLAIVGGALYAILPLAFTVGTIILLLAMVSAALGLSERTRSKYSFWLGLIVYSLLVDGATTMGRAGFGPGQALSTRYATFSLLAVIGVYGILSSMAATTRAQPIAALWGCMFGLIVPGLALSMTDGFDFGKRERLAKEYQAFVLSTAETQPDIVLAGSTNSPEPRDGGAALLKRHGWNVFAPGGASERYALPAAGLPVLPERARIEMNQFGVIKDTNYLTVSGWAVNAEGNDVAGGLFLEIDDKLYPVFYGIPRVDVAQALKTARLEQCGFQRAFPLKFWPKGRHRLNIKVLTKDGKAFFSSPGPMEFNSGE
jgi:hypothetical protein